MGASGLCNGMKTISTYIRPELYLEMKRAVEADGLKLYRWLEEAIELRIAQTQQRQNAAGQKD
jgi:hypothetical protein